jgi:hypothetical protein
LLKLTNFATNANKTEDLSVTALGVAEETVRTDGGGSSANLDGAGNGSGSKESGGSEELHLE